MKQINLLMAFIFLLPLSVLAQLPQLPADELWQTDFDSTAVCLGSVWLEDGHVCMLVGLKDRAVLLQDGQSVWESESRGSLRWATRVNFGTGLGNEFLILTDTSDGQSSGEVRLDRYRDGQLTASRPKGFYYPDVSQPPGYTLQTPVAIFQLNYGTVDSTEAVELLYNSSGVSVGSNGYFSGGSSAYLKRIFLGGGEGEMGINCGRLQSWRLIDDDDDGQLSLLTAGYSTRSYCAGYGDVTHEASASYLHYLDTDLSIIHSESIELDGDGVENRFDALNYDDFTHESAILRVATGGRRNYHLANYSLPGLRLIDGENTPLPPDLYPIRWIPYQTHPNNEFDCGYYLLTTAEGVVATFNPSSESLTRARFQIPSPVLDFQVGDFDGDGGSEYIVLTPTAIYFSRVGSLSAPTEEGASLIPYAVSLSSFPNPFNSSTTISYMLPRSGWTTMDVVDISGRLVTRLSDGWKEAGSYREVWNGEGFTSGIYLVKMETQSFSDIRKVTLIR